MVGGPEGLADQMGAFRPTVVFDPLGDGFTGQAIEALAWGQFSTVIDSILPLQEVNAAFERIVQRSARGRIPVDTSRWFQMQIFVITSGRGWRPNGHRIGQGGQPVVAGELAAGRGWPRARSRRPGRAARSLR